MKTLYDLLGSRPSDNAETLRAAFRKAAKANHPDLHAGDPYAAMRFREIAQAYEILRDAQRRATYDRLLAFERERVRWKFRSAVSYLMHSVVSDAVTAIGLALVLAGGYLIYAHISKTPAEDLTGRGSSRIAVVQPAGQTNTNKPGERRDGPERNAGRGMIVPNEVGTAGLNAEVANIADAVTATSTKRAAGSPDQTAGTDNLDHDKAQLVKVLSSSGETDNGSGKSFSSDFAISGDKREMKRRETHDMNASDAKISDAKLPETKIPPRARIAAKRQAAGHTTFEQAALENRNACSGSCTRDVPPLFGVGF